MEEYGNCMKQIIEIYLIVINIAAFVVMGIDKIKAKKHMWRIPEKTLFALAISGGSIGAIAGMYIFRHKTKHIKFIMGMPVILILQILIIVIFLTTGCGKKYNNEKNIVDNDNYEVNGDGSYIPEKFTLSGEKFVFPCTLDDFKKINYVVNSQLGVFDLSDLQPGEDDRFIQLIENYDTINVYIKNDSDTIRNINECQIYGIELADNILEGEELEFRDFMLSNGIGLGTPFDAVINFYKDKECIIEKGKISELSYTEKGLTITYNALNGVVKGISIVPS